LTAQSLHLVERGRAVVVVPCSSITQIVAAYGSQSPHPILLAILGIALLLIGLLPIPFFLNWFGSGGTIHTSEVWIIPISVIGLSLLPGAFRRGYYLHVRSTVGSKRLAFNRAAGPAGLEPFLATVEAALGIRIERKF